MIEKPTPISSSPIPTTQPRFKPVTGRFFEASVVVGGVLLVEGETDFAAVLAGVVAYFVGDVPLVGDGVVVAGVVVAGVVAGGVVVVVVVVVGGGGFSL